MAATDEQSPEYVAHPLLAPETIERREYQLELAETARSDHALVCLPTGLGKTTVSLLVTADRLREFAEGDDEASDSDDVTGETDAKALFLAPTKPLVRQHADFYREALTIPDDEVVVFTGEVSPDERTELWDDARVVVATPQVVENDLVGERIDLADVVHLTFDECHRATGDYAYNYIAERYHADADHPLVTGMSASPGGDEESIQLVCENLGIREVTVMTESDSDVSEYTHRTDVDWVTVEMPDELLAIRDALNEVISERLGKLQELGVTSSTDPALSEGDLQQMRSRLQSLVDRGESKGYEGLSLHAEVRKLKTAVTYVETQSVAALGRYLERQREDARSSGASKATQRLVSDPRVRRVRQQVADYDGRHPKFERTRTALAETLGLGDGERAIVFTESRDTAELLVEFLEESFAVRRFVGQGDRDGSDGMTQNEQAATIEAFRDGEFEVLVSTSVAEEGLDVPSVDLVLFYEPVPTAIRSIQRKGRTGRSEAGRVVVLMAEDTRDEAYFWISRRREEEMEEELRALKSVADEVTEELSEGQSHLGQFDDGWDGDGGDAEAGHSGAGTRPALQDFAGDGADADGSSASDGPAGTEAGDADGEAGDGDDGAATVAIAGVDADADGPVGDGAVGDDGADADGGDADSDPDTDGDAGDETDTVEIVVDQRETDSAIARDLSKRDRVSVRLETLAVGDYVLSDRVVVERKTVEDFLGTLTGERSLFDQVGDMTRHYARPVVVVEGEGLYQRRNVHPNAIRGALASLAVDFDASVLFTSDEADTADLLAVVAEREQTRDDRSVSVHGEKGGRTLAEQQEYVVAAIADIGPVTARSLLSEFGSVEAVMTASREDLEAAEGVGEVTAERIREVAASTYEGS